MDRLKTFGKYILWIIGFMIFTYICTFVGLNSTYKNINYIEEPISQINVEIAQATIVNGRIYGEITNTEENYINDQYMRVEIFNSKKESVGIKYLKIENLDVGRTKKFTINFTAENVKYYTIDIVENSVKTEEENQKAQTLYSDIFTEEQLSEFTVIGLVLLMMI